jgi:hypothetical protein
MECQLFPLEGDDTRTLPLAYFFSGSRQMDQLVRHHPELIDSKLEATEPMPSEYTLGCRDNAYSHKAS